MRKSVIVFIVMAGLLTIGAVTDVMAFRIVTRDMIEKEVVTRTDLIKTVDNFIVLFDTSNSSNRMVPGRDVSRIMAAKNMLKERNAWFPELGHQAGLYIYTADDTLAGTFREVSGMQTFNRQAFAEAIDQLPESGRGGATLNAGLSPLRRVLAGLSGKTAVIMFTDGTVTRARGMRPPLQIAQEMARDNDVCFYLISSATPDVEKRLVDVADQINTCSRVIPLAQFLDNPLYLSGALFTVKTTAYARIKPVTEVVGFIANDMHFDFDSSAIRGDYDEKLDILGSYLQNNPNAFAVAAGYTCNIGTEAYNLWLSERRVESFKNRLVDKYGIDANRVVTLWYGPFNPVADNATSEGRQRNRRVEIAVGTGN